MSHPISNSNNSCDKSVSEETTRQSASTTKRSSDALDTSTNVSQASDNVSITNKRSRNASNSKKNDENVFDGAYVYGLNAGDRLTVKWEIVENEGTTNERTVEHWWGATLLEYDGRTYIEDDECNDDEEDDKNNGPVAVHVLEYDEYPEGGFPDKSREEVVFASAFELVDMKSQDMLPYKREGDDGMIAVFDSNNGFEEMVNTVLTNAMKKSFPNFESLPAAIQLQVAEKIAAKKKKLVELMEEFFRKSGKRIGTPKDMKDLIEKTMQD